MNQVFGLTGGIASGKSTVAKMLRERGAYVIDADDLARQVVEPGTPGLAAVIGRFGREVLGPNGSLDRTRLGEIVFSNAEARADLEAILHPLISTASMSAILAAIELPKGPVFYDAALLVEKGTHKNFAALVVVGCSPMTQTKRVLARDGLTLPEAEARIAAQLPLADKMQAADHVLLNDGTIEELAAQVDALLATLTGK
ncbi:MAG: dephospho-CoA kinase [Bradymonadia bacterium]